MIGVALKDAQKLAAVAGRTLPKNSPKPILNAVLVTANEGVVRFTTYNATSGFHVQAPEISGGEERFVVQEGERFLNVLKLAEGSDVSLVHEGDRVLLLAGKSRLNLPAGDAREYPEIPLMKEFAAFPGLIRALYKTVPFAAKDPFSSMAGVQVAIREGRWTVEATSGREAARLSGVVERSDEEWLITPEDARDACAAFPAEETVYAKQQGAFLLVSDGLGTTWATRLLERKFIQMEPIFAVAPAGHWSASRPALLGAVKRTLAAVADKDNKSALIAFDKDFLKIIGKSPYGDIEEVIDAQYTGEPKSFGFDLRYLQHLLAQWESEEVRSDLFSLNHGLGMRLRGENEEYVLAGVLTR